LDVRLLEIVKVAVVPAKVVVVTGTPLADKVTLVILAGFPVPLTTESVRLVTVTVELLLLASTTCSTGTLVAPESWFELAGAVPEAVTVTAMGVPVGLLEAVAVKVKVGVKVGVWVGVDVGVAVAGNTVTVAPVIPFMLNPLNWTA
jgi:hypothetical protein